MLIDYLREKRDRLVRGSTDAGELLRDTLSILDMRSKSLDGRSLVREMQVKINMPVHI